MWECLYFKYWELKKKYFCVCVCVYARAHYTLDLSTLVQIWNRLINIPSWDWLKSSVPWNASFEGIKILLNVFWWLWSSDFMIPPEWINELLLLLFHLLFQLYLSFLAIFEWYEKSTQFHHLREILTKSILLWNVFIIDRLQ